MTGAISHRSGLGIVTDLYDLTCEMTKRLDDPDFLIQGVEKRQALMDEYDVHRQKHPRENTVEARKLVEEIIAMDSKINSSLVLLKGEARRKMVDIRSRQKALADNQKAAPSGTFLNLSK